MIKYNNNSINDWYFDTSDIVKVYRNNAVRYQKIYGGSTATPKWIATYEGGVTASAECDSTSAITSTEIVKTNLTDVVIGDCVTSIGSKAFYNCRGLTSATIPDSVTSISDYAFQNCESLISVTIPNSVTSIGIYAFYDCISLTSINIPDNVTSIGEYTFYNCQSLSSVTIPNSVTSIGFQAFGNCSSLTSITIPNSVTSISGYAFNNCSALTSITSLAPTPPTIGNGVFQFTSCPIYVPAESVEAYKAAWREYASRIQAIQ